MTAISAVGRGTAEAAAVGAALAVQAARRETPGVAVAAVGALQGKRAVVVGEAQAVGGAGRTWAPGLPASSSMPYRQANRSLLKRLSLEAQ